MPVSQAWLMIECKFETEKVGIYHRSGYYQSLFLGMLPVMNNFFCMGFIPGTTEYFTDNSI